MDLTSLTITGIEHGCEMPQIKQFRGLRYDLGHVGSLADVVAPPYDVIDGELQDQLYKRHPANVVRLILNRDEPGDDDRSKRYYRASRFLKNWVREGMLVSEPEPALYVYHQQYEHAGATVTRRGFMGLVRLEPFGQGNIFPHEETHSAAKQDRLELIRSCQANLSPIFGLYPDPENVAQNLLESTIQTELPVEATDHLGVVHRLWTVSDLRVINQLSACLANKQMYIADGHHRYETACNYRDELAEKSSFDKEHPANYVLTMCVSMDDPGMLVLPTHRLFRGLNSITVQQLADRAGSCLRFESFGQGTEVAGRVWQTILDQQQQGVLGFYTRADNTWTLATITDEGRQRMDQLAPDQCGCWRQLGVSILHRLVMEDLLDAASLPQPMYVHTVNEVISGLQQGDTVGRDATGQDAAGGQFELASLVMPASLDDIREISHQQQRMPAKSTYFYPKLLSGLVINPLQ